MTRELALSLTKQAEQWATAYSRGDCMLWQSQWAWNRANAAWDQVIDNPYTIENEQAHANARLIAAAPDLLAALEAMLEAEQAYEWGRYSEQELSARDKARTAIAKARG